MLAASAAFRVSPNATTAADVVGAILTRWHYIALAGPLMLFGLELRHARKFMLIVLFVALLLAAAQAFVDLRIRSMRNALSVPISSLDRTDPLRRTFGMLHGVSMMLLVAQAVLAATVVASTRGPRVPESPGTLVVGTRASLATSVPSDPETQGPRSDRSLSP